ncbi:MAG TPA: hypothetical protein VM489_07420 [Burkholderiales bacterium]|nr:hypothetical protein [Burkholderiales bacterium]
MDILAVEPEASIAAVFGVAVERARPGTAVRFAPDVDTAIRTVSDARRAGEAPPRLVVLGPQALREASAGTVLALRESLPPSAPLLGLALDAEGLHRAGVAGLEAAYRYHPHWEAFAGEVRRLMQEWLPAPS